jgi:hypothetical protein
LRHKLVLQQRDSRVAANAAGNRVPVLPLRFGPATPILITIHGEPAESEMAFWPPIAPDAIIIFLRDVPLPPVSSLHFCQSISARFFKRTDLGSAR